VGPAYKANRELAAVVSPSNPKEKPSPWRM
jgi:hypothetical protein